jgi:hypothetical protein
MKKALGVLKLSPKSGIFCRGAFFSDVDRTVKPTGMGARMFHVNMKPECEGEMNSQSNCRYEAEFQLMFR